jgi:NADPH:quinone reductase-like Zn-dependent oxidoreductase
MPQSARAIVVDPAHRDKLTLQPVDLPPAVSGDVTVRVTAISLNRGEVNRALSQSAAGARPGWDFAGIIDEAAADGSGPPAGTRVVGMLSTGAWAERLRAPSHAVAALPDKVTDAQAATLPVAGLTALHALRQGGPCRRRRSRSMARQAVSATSRSSSLPPRAPMCTDTYGAPSRNQCLRNGAATM